MLVHITIPVHECSLILFILTDFGDFIMHVLRARIRNPLSISTVVDSHEGLRSQEQIPRPVNIGFHGLPVFTTACGRDTAAGVKMLGETVWHLVNKRGVPTSSIAVIMYTAMLNPMEDLPKLTAMFYKEMRNLYKNQLSSGGQHNSLIPLPLYSFDSRALEFGLEEARVLWKDLRQQMENHFDQVKDDFDKTEVWLEAVNCFIWPGHNQDSEVKIPACEKVRSILLHLLWKCIFEDGKHKTGVELKDEFFKVCDEDFKKAAIRKSKISQDPTVLVSDTFGNFLNRYRYITLSDVWSIQGCEFDYVVYYCREASIRPVFLPVSLALSRSKQLAIVAFQKDKENAQAYWPGPWHDWDEEMKKNTSYH